MLGIFTPVKIQRLRPGLNPQTWMPEASMLTTRPPKPSFKHYNKQVKLNSFRRLSDSRKIIALWKVPRIHPFALLVRTTCRWRKVWITDGMILTGDNWSTRRKTCPNATLPTKYLIWNDLESTPGLCVESSGRKYNCHRPFGIILKYLIK